MADYHRYVSLTGNDAAAGDKEHPWQKINTAMQRFRDKTGDLSTFGALDRGYIHVEPGTYHEVSTGGEAYGNYGSWNLAFSFAGMVTIQSTTGDAADVHISGAGDTAYSYTYSIIVMRRYNGSAYEWQPLKNCTFKDVTLTADCGTGKEGAVAFTVYSNAFSGTPDANAKLENVWFDHCDFRSEKTGKALSCGFYWPQQDTPTFRGDGIHFYKCRFYNVVSTSKTPALNIYSNANNAGYLNDVTVIGCEFYGYSGMYLTSITNVEIRGNKLGTLASPLSYISAEIGMERASGTAGEIMTGIVVGNECYTTANHGLLIGGISTDSDLLVENNYSEAAGHAFLFRGARNTTARNNTFKNTAINSHAAVLCKGGINCVFEDNTVIATASLAISNDDGSLAGQYVGNNYRIRRNLFVANDIEAIMIWTAAKDSTEGAYTPVDYNTYIQDGLTNAFLDNIWATNGFTGDKNSVVNPEIIETGDTTLRVNEYQVTQECFEEV